ncbi:MULTISPECIES: hypothetical protein [Streptomyces]|uniref:hypothetical protein n=1 Tax=Streptomyces TaxID=1883 RepID=UPI00017F0FCC|nr:MULTISPECIES: hypothetical protein [Streptomyces]AKL68686.1 hypothetical protein M444_28325 [Streptomyces sp. Mg1]RPK35420.1 hypothetical protein EES37_28400 [Streptomyces sp. ADI91-18]WBY22937.1 hypothetical protein PET44_26855 [Streptomyces goshikiensis]
MTEQQEASEDAVMTRIGQAVILLHAGDREEARNRLGEIWAEIGAEGDSLHRCTLAHYMADAQDDPADELAWDLRALTAADGLRPGEEPGLPPGRRPGQGVSPTPGEGPGQTPGEGAGQTIGEGAGQGVGQGARPGPQQAVRVFYPSLHLSLAADYVKLRRPEAARIHLARARAATGALADDGYGNGVRAAIARLERRLAAEPGEGPRPFPEQYS